MKSESDVTIPIVILILSVYPGFIFPIKGLSVFIKILKLLNSLLFVMRVS